MSLKTLHQPGNPDLVQFGVFLRVQEVAVIDGPKKRGHFRVLPDNFFEDKLAQLRFTDPPRILFETLAWLVTYVPLMVM